MNEPRIAAESIPAEEMAAQITASTAQAQADALKRAALAMAIEHHDNASRHPRSRGAASSTAVTATARDFLRFLREVGDRANAEQGETESPR